MSQHAKFHLNGFRDNCIRCGFSTVVIALFVLSVICLALLVCYAFSNCGPGTIIGKKLASAGWGLGESTFGKHLGVIRKLLIEKGILADESKSKKRSRTRDYDPSSVIQEDINQSDPFEQTADRDDFAQLRNKGEKTKAGDDNIYTDPIPNAPPDTRSQELPEDLQDSTDE